MADAPFARTLVAGWASCDVNGHMRNSAYLDMATDARMLYFAEHGFTVTRFERLGVGPVVKSDLLEYLREIRLMQPVRVEVRLSGMSHDGSRMRLRNDFVRDDGVLAARLRSEVGWLDLAARKLRAPPEELLRAMREMPRDENFEPLRSSVRGEKAAASADGPAL
jgi:acyl-CoA thioester hydrolase